MLFSNSFENIERWLTELRQHADSNITIMLVGNKSDLKHLREIPEDRATSFCEEHGLNLVETSAKDNSNVEFAFQKLITEIYHEIIRKTVLDNDSGTSKGITFPPTNKTFWRENGEKRKSIFGYIFSI